MNITVPTSLANILEESFQQHADKPAFSCLGQTLNFKDIDEKSTALAKWLQRDSGLNQGDRVAIQLPNLTQYPIAAYAILRAGMVIVNTNPLYTEREMAHQLKDSGAKAIFIFQDRLPSLNSIITDTQISKVIEVGPADLLTGSTTLIDENNHGFCQLLTDNPNVELQPRSNDIDETIVLQYTGGTTGVSKGAELSNKNIVSNYLQNEVVTGDFNLVGEEISVAPLPLYHIYAFGINIVMSGIRGSLSVLIPNPRDLDATVAAMKPFKFTSFSGINTLFVALCHHEGFKELDFSKLKLTCSGGSTLTSSAYHLWESITGCTISEGYGLSETSPVLTMNKPREEEIGTVGKPLPDTIIEIRNSNNVAVAHGEEGEIVAKGPQVMKGYWNLSAETNNVMTEDGFFKTGDIGIRLPSGSIKIVDRMKDMIIVSGFNVYPNEIEEILTLHPLIIEAAVIGENDDTTGERVCAYITVRDELDVEQVIAHCREQLTPYKVPKKVVILDELPKSTVGKILRRELRA